MNLFINYLFIFFISVSSADAYYDPSLFNSSVLEFEEIFIDNSIRQKTTEGLSALSSDLVDSILTDKNNLIDDNFTISDYFSDAVRFWFSIYTQYNSGNVLIHDINNLALVYNILDFSHLQKSDINNFAKSQLQTQLALDFVIDLKKILAKFASTSDSNLTENEKMIWNTIGKSYKIPSKKTDQSKFFAKLSSSLRTQTGQRDMIFHGVVNSMPYLDYLYSQLDLFKLPHELLAIPFLESSFNTEAISRVGASGIWQFMPHIANLLLPPITNNLDHRNNPITASFAAFHLLSENIFLLKSWDLAVTAYNSGTKHLLLAKKKFKNVGPLNLEYVLTKYEHPHLGFASKNFYAEFLALVHVLAYRNSIFPLTGLNHSKQLFDPKKLQIYVSHCSVRPAYIYKSLKRSNPQLSKLNRHYLDDNYLYPAGSVIVSDRSLSKKKYYLLTSAELKKLKPLSYKDLIKNKCN